MKEIKQHHVTYLTLFNTLVVMGIIAFFFRKYLELTKREDERDQRIERLEKKLIESDKHHKAVMSRMTKKMAEGMMVHPPAHPAPYMVAPSIEEEIEPEERNDIEEALESLLA